MIKVLEELKITLVEDGNSHKTIQSYIGDIAGILKYLETMETEFDGSLRRFYVTKLQELSP